jgi:hypothetical protein
MAKDNKQVALLDICYPDYFSGYHYPVAAVYVYGKITNAEVAESLEQEIHALYEYFFELYPKHEKYYKKYISELKKNPNEIFFDPNFEDERNEDEDLEFYLCAYFSVINPVTVNVCGHSINFLDS